MSTTKQDTITVDIRGPYSQGVAFHVVADGDADLKRKAIYRDMLAARGGKWVVDITDFTSLVTAIYPPDEHGYDASDEQTIANLASDIYLHPSVPTLAGQPVAPPKTGRGYSTVSKDGEMTCRVCAQTMPVTKFPTKAPNADGEIVRDDRCRKCRDERRDNNKVDSEAAQAEEAAKAKKAAAAAKRAATLAAKKAAKEAAANTEAPAGDSEQLPDEGAAA